MNIESAKWVVSKMTDEKSGIEAVIDGQIWFVTNNPDCRFYKEITKQVDAGTLTIKDAD